MITDSDGYWVRFPNGSILLPGIGRERLLPPKVEDNITCDRICAMLCVKFWYFDRLKLHKLREWHCMPTTGLTFAK